MASALMPPQVTFGAKKVSGAYLVAMIRKAEKPTFASHLCFIQTPADEGFMVLVTAETQSAARRSMSV